MRKWAIIAAFCLPAIIVAGWVSYRRLHHHILVPDESHDPTVINTNLAALMTKWEQAPFVNIDGIDGAALTNIDGWQQSAALNASQQQLLLARVTDLLRAHRNGDVQFLKSLMIPCGDERNVKLSWHGEGRIPHILEAAKGAGADLKKGNPWEDTEAAWRWIVPRFGLTNWWEAVSLDQSRFRLHQSESVSQIPPVTSTNIYGDFAGMAWGESLLVYPEALFPASNQPPITIAAVRLLVRIHDQQKVIPFVFRWRWSAACNNWFPYDSLTGAVGDRRADPFF